MNKTVQLIINYIPIGSQKTGSFRHIITCTWLDSSLSFFNWENAWNSWPQTPLLHMCPRLCSCLGEWPVTTSLDSVPNPIRSLISLTEVGGESKVSEKFHCKYWRTSRHSSRSHNCCQRLNANHKPHQYSDQSTCYNITTPTTSSLAQPPQSLRFPTLQLPLCSGD